MLKKIISGGQTGADQGGLVAGLAMGLLTGGTAPPRFITEVGPSPDLLKYFGLKEGIPDSSTYVKRTIQNVYDSNGTAWFGDVATPGGKLTINTAKRLGRPICINASAKELAKWIKDNDIEVLNVAGNRESKNEGIGNVTCELLMKAGGLLHLIECPHYKNNGNERTDIPICVLTDKSCLLQFNSGCDAYEAAVNDLIEEWVNGEAADIELLFEL
jgi:hypothetical protein